MTDDPKEDGAEQEPASEGSPASRSEDRIDELQQGIDRVGERIEEAEEEADKAEALDPQPLSGPGDARAEDGEQNSPG
jgi:hypothetical protein